MARLQVRWSGSLEALAAAVGSERGQSAERPLRCGAGCGERGTRVLRQSLERNTHRGERNEDEVDRLCNRNDIR